MDNHASTSSSTLEHEDEEQKQERTHFRSVLHSFASYSEWGRLWLDHSERSFSKIAQKHRNLVPNASSKFDGMRKRINSNQMFINLLIAENQHLFENQHMDFTPTNDGSTLPHEKGIEKVRSTLRQLVRDWSTEGEEERCMCYKPILDELTTRYPNKSQRQAIKVLNPGAGLGRLPFEIARLGFDSQGNEFSYHMLICSNFMLNKSRAVEEFSIFPYVTQTSNVVRDSDMLREIRIPDVVPIDELNAECNFSMAGGEFVEVYKDQLGEWDCVVTSFFLDTAKNVIEYVEVISSVLKSGGVWINFGPLLYHYAEMENEISIELSYEQLRRVILHYGFKFEVPIAFLYVTDNHKERRKKDFNLCKQQTVHDENSV